MGRLPQSANDQLAALATACPRIAYRESDFADSLATLSSDELGEIKRWDELFLSRACLSGDAAALAYWRKHYDGRMRSAICKVVTGDDADDVHQRVLIKLLVGPEPRLARYHGRGSLRSWLGVISANEALDWLRRTKKTKLIDTLVDEVMRIEESHPAELTPLPRTTTSIKQALRNLVEKMPTSDREILACYAAGLTLYDAAKITGLHRVTVSRRLAKIRGALLDQVREVLNDDVIAPHLVLQKITLSIQRILDAHTPVLRDAV